MSFITYGSCPAADPWLLNTPSLSLDNQPWRDPAMGEVVMQVGSTWLAH